MSLGISRVLASFCLVFSFVFSVSACAAEDLSPDLLAAQASCPQWQAVAINWSVPAAGQRGILLYLWSPRMVLSVQHAAQMQAAAQSLGLRWQAMHDPRISAQEIASTLQAAAVSAQVRKVLDASVPLCDADLLAQGQTLRHFPAAWVYQQNATRGWLPRGLPIIGVMPLVFWRQAIAERQSGIEGKNR